MRIVKLGVPKGGLKLTGKCPGCKTVIEFLYSEAEEVRDARDGDFLRIQCPVCPRAITQNIPRVPYLG